MSDYVFPALMAGGLFLVNFMTRRTANTSAHSDHDSLLESTLDEMTVASTSTTLQKQIVLFNKSYSFHDCCDISDACECENGFKRPDFKKDSMLNRLAYYDKHIFVCINQKSTEWSAETETEGICGLISEQCKKIKKNCKVRVNVIEQASSNEQLDCVDLIIFPEAIQYKNVKSQHIAELIETHCVQNKTFLGVASETLDGSTFAFICCHHQRDQKCATCGPRIFKSMVSTLQTTSVQQQLKQLPSQCQKVQVHRTSCVMGHKYAGNVIIFKYNPGLKKYFGDWYGYVDDDNDVELLVQKHIIEGKIVKEIWRGRMAMELDAEKFLKFV